MRKALRIAWRTLCAIAGAAIGAGLPRPPRRRRGSARTPAELPAVVTGLRLLFFGAMPERRRD